MCKIPFNYDNLTVDTTDENDDDEDHRLVIPFELRTLFVISLTKLVYLKSLKLLSFCFHYYLN